MTVNIQDAAVSLRYNDFPWGEMQDVQITFAAVLCAFSQMDLIATTLSLLSWHKSVVHAPERERVDLPLRVNTKQPESNLEFAQKKGSRNIYKGKAKTKLWKMLCVLGLNF